MLGVQACLARYRCRASSAPSLAVAHPMAHFCIESLQPVIRSPMWVWSLENHPVALVGAETPLTTTITVAILAQCTFRGQRSRGPFFAYEFESHRHHFFQPFLCFFEYILQAWLLLASHRISSALHAFSGARSILREAKVTPADIESLQPGMRSRGLNPSCK